MPWRGIPKHETFHKDFVSVNSGRVNTLKTKESIIPGRFGLLEPIGAGSLEELAHYMTFPWSQKSHKDSNTCQTSISAKEPLWLNSPVCIGKGNHLTYCGEIKRSRAELIVRWSDHHEVNRDRIRIIKSITRMENSPEIPLVSFFKLNSPLILNAHVS